MNVGELTAYLTVDDKGLKSGVAGAQKDLTGLGRTAETATGQVTSGTAKATSSIGSFVKGIGLATAAWATLSAGIRSAAAQETASVTFTSLLQSGEKAQAFLSDLADFAARTPFDLPGLQQASSRLISVGVETERVIPLMEVLGDSTAAMGTGAEGIDRATMALQQMAVKGKVTGEEMLQLTEAGVPAWEALAASIGVTTSEVQEMVSQGTISVDQLYTALENRTGETLQRTAGMMDTQSATFAGMWATMKDTITQELGTENSGLMLFLKDQIPQATDAAVAAIRLFGFGTQAALLVLGPVLDLLGVAVDLFTALPAPIQAALSAWLFLQSSLGGKVIGAFNTALAKGSIWFDNWGAGADKAAGSTGRLSGVMSSLKGPAIAAALGLIVTAISDIGNNADDAKKKFGGFAEGLDFNDADAAASALQKLQAAYDDAAESFNNDDMAGGWFSFLTDADENFDAAQAAMDEFDAAQTYMRENAALLAAQLGISTEAALRFAAAHDIDLVGFIPDADGLVPLINNVDLSTEAVEELGAELQRTGAQQDLADALAVIGDEAATGADKVDAFKQALDALLGDEMSQAEATANMNEEFRNLTDTFTELTGLGYAAGAGLVDAAGKIDTTTAAGGLLHDQMMALGESFNTATTAAYNTAIAEGRDGMAAAAAEADRLRQSFIDQAVGMGMPIAQAIALADSYGLLPGSVVTAILAPGATETDVQIAEIAAKLLALPEGETITITSLTAEAEQRLRDLNFNVTHMDDGTISVSASTAAAENALNQTARNRTSTVYQYTVKAAATGGLFESVQGFPGGGQVRGPGSATSDSINARLSNGEYIIKAGVVKSVGVPFFDWVNAGGDPWARGYARGGLVAATTDRSFGSGEVIENQITITLDGDVLARTVNRVNRSNIGR